MNSRRRRSLGRTLLLGGLILWLVSYGLTYLPDTGWRDVLQLLLASVLIVVVLAFAGLATGFAVQWWRNRH